MEWAVCTASSDSKDSTTQERDEGEWAHSSTDQQGSLYEVAQEASTNEAWGSISFAFVAEASSTRNGWNSRGSVKAGKKPPSKHIQGSIHFGKKDGNKVPVPHGMRSACTVNTSEEDGISYSESEELVTEEEDLGEEFHNATAEFGVGRKENLKRSELQKKKRNFTEGQRLASKLAKRTAQHRKNQMPFARTGWGDSSSHPSRCQWSGSVQAGPLEANYAEDPANFTQSTESFIHPSQLVEHQEVHTKTVTYNCPNCNVSCTSARLLRRHCIYEHYLTSRYRCPECITHFGTADGVSIHRRLKHKVDKAYPCLECDEMVKNAFELRRHRLIAHNVYDAKGFTVDEALDFPWEGKE